MADVIINTEIKFDVDNLLKRFEKLATDDKTMLEIYNLFGKLIEPWVPMDNGILAHGYEITPNYIRYPGPYAHYQYMGIVYGPNIPLFDDAGQLIGFYSPPGERKSPKEPEQKIIYNEEKHKRASKKWDKAAYPVIKDQFLQGVKDILIRRWGELYGNN